MSKALIERFAERYVELQKLPNHQYNTQLYWWYSDARNSGLTWYDIGKIRGVTDLACLMHFKSLGGKYHAPRVTV